MVTGDCQIVYAQTTPTATPLGNGWYDVGVMNVPAGTTSLTIEYSPTEGGNVAAPGALALVQNVATTTYDLDGENLSEVDSDNNVTATAYDSFGRTVAGFQGQIITTSAPASEYTSSPYPQWTFGNLAPNSLLTYNVYAYSTAAPSTFPTVTGGSGQPTWLSTPTAGTPLGTDWYLLGTVPVLSSTSSLQFKYSSGGAPTEMAIDDQTSAMAFDADGDLLQKTDALGQVTAFQYDALNRETGEQWYPNAIDVGNPNDATNKIAYTYDLDNEILTAQDDYSAYKYTYNSLGEALTVDNEGSETNGTPNVPDVVLSSTYDADGNRTSLSATIGTTNTPDFVNGYTYNSLNEEVQVTQGPSSGHDYADNKQVNFTYYANGEVATITRLAGSLNAEVAQSAYTYDGSGRLTKLTHTAANGSTTYANDTWTHDADDEVTSFTNAANITSYSDENVTAYSYDSTGELVSATGPQNQGNTSNSLSNQYDANGNATTLNGAGAAIGPNNELLSDGAYTETYDADGNLKSQFNSSSSTLIQYTYDNRNRLTGVTCSVNGTESYSIVYTYDMFNNLIGRTVTTYGTGGTTTTQRYVFDGTNMVLAFDGSGNLTDRYLWGPAVDQVLADENYSPGSSGEASNGGLPTSPGTTLWALGDNQNSVRDVVTDAGTLEQHIAYSPFGQQVSGLTTTGSVVPSFAFGYTGTYTDRVTGLQLHGVRWYDSAVGRWLSEDPAKYGRNWYSYCSNNPTDATDPTGLHPHPLAGEVRDDAGRICASWRLRPWNCWFSARRSRSSSNCETRSKRHTRMPAPRFGDTRADRTSQRGRLGSDSRELG